MLFSTISFTTILLAFTSTTSGSPLQERSLLKLQKDFLIAGLTSYSGILKLSVAPTDADIVKFASAGWHEIQKLGAQQPGAMVALQPKSDPTRLYMASSIKGGAGNYWTHLRAVGAGQTPLLRVLEACEAATGAAHRTSAACAEPNVLDLIMTAHPEFTSFSQLFQYVHGAKFVPIVGAEVVPPCSATDNNCSVLVTDTLKMLAIGHGTVAKNDGDSLKEFTMQTNLRPVSH